MKKIFLLSLLSMLQTACQPTQKAFSATEVRAIADKRFIANAKALGGNDSIAPTPRIEARTNDTVFVYVEQLSKKKIIVIVEKDGHPCPDFRPEGTCSGIL